jgi:hypothetical protein
MARASNIYLVVWQDYDGVDVLAAFTVKHEMVTWLRKQAPKDLVGCDILRMPDGRDEEGTRIRIKDLLSASN